MKFQWKKHLIGYTAVATTCIMIGSAATLAMNPVANAEKQTQQVVVTSPFTQAIHDVRDSVVGVSNYQMVRYRTGGSWEDYFGGYFGYGSGNRNNSSIQEQEVLAGTGSGVVVGKDYVLTNYHVVEGSTSLKITVSNGSSEEPTEYDAALVAYDENLDIAVVHVPNLNLNPVPLGDSDSLQVGDWAICIGNPLGEQFSGTVTTGIISALDRAVSSNSVDKYGRRETITNTMIQTDAAINSGNSGGGLFSVSGELMGIPTLKYTGSAYSRATVEGIGMAIPINAAKPLIEDVLSGNIDAANKPNEQAGASGIAGNLTGKPRLGVTIAGINTSSAAVRNGDLPNGVYIKEVEKNGPAEKAGMIAGDIIVDVDNTVITSTSQLQEIISEHREGDELAIKVYRVPGMTTLDGNEEIPDGEYVDLKVILAVVDDIKQ